MNEAQLIQKSHSNQAAFCWSMHGDQLETIAKSSSRNSNRVIPIEMEFDGENSQNNDKS